MRIETIEKLRDIQDNIENAAALAEEANAIVQTFYTAHADERQPEVMPCEVTALGAADSLHHIYSDKLNEAVEDLMKLIKEK